MPLPEHPGNEPGYTRGGNQCTARSKQAGRRCRRPATPGTNVCTMHGSKTPRVQAAIARREVEAEAVELVHRYNLEPLTDPWNALAELGAEILAVHHTLSARIDTASDTMAGPTVAAWERALDRAAKFLLDFSKLELDDKRFMVSKIQTNQLAAGFQASCLEVFARIRNSEPLDDIEADLPNIIRRHLNPNEER